MGALGQKIWQHKNILIISAIIAAVAVGTAMYLSKNSKPAFTGATMTVQRGDIKATVAATGSVNAVNSVAVSSKITGRIIDVKVTENEMVTVGQTLIILDDTSIRAQLNQSHAQLMNATANYERSKQLAAIGGESLQQLDADKMNIDVAQANYDNIASQLDDTVIKAPISGMVIGKPIPAGQTVSPGISTPMLLLTVADLSVMQVWALVDETDIGSVQLGQKVDFTVDAHPGKTFTGKVSLISQSAVVQQNVIYYTVYIDVDSANGLLFPTMTARLTINTGESDNVLIVPLSAVKENKGQKLVQVLVNGKPQSVQVQLGLADDEKVEVISGLKEGDQVVLPTAKPQTGATGSTGGSNSTNPMKSTGI